MNNHRQGRPLDHALIDRIHRLHQAGHPYRAIARETGVSYNTVKKYTMASQTHDPLSRRTASGPLSRKRWRGDMAPRLTRECNG